MTTEQLIKYLKEGTTGSDVTKTDVFLDSLMMQAAAKIELLEAQVTSLGWEASNSRDTESLRDRDGWRS